MESYRVKLLLVAPMPLLLHHLLIVLFSRSRKAGF